MSKCNIYLCQVNNRFGPQVYLPYSVGVLQAYCQQFEEVRKNFDFRELLYLRDPLPVVIERLRSPQLLGLSCYSWNWEYSMALGRAVKKAHPDCLVVIGGPHVPHRSEFFFVEHPYVDILVHGEGEITLYEILQQFLERRPDYKQVRGLTIKHDGNRAFETPPRERIDNLDSLPSPYLSGIFDDLVNLPYRWNACQETHRGCPYSCTFCDWGSAVFTKVRAFDSRRVVEELEWFALHEIEVLYNCDANYGLLPRDVWLTQELVRVRQKHGFPKQFRPAFAKNSDDRVFEIAKTLHCVNLQKGITLSVQSMDESCLEVIKRKNIRIENLAQLLKRYRAEGIPTYTELILGLPGETYNSFKRGFHELFVAGQHDGCYVNLCQLLPNSEMSDPRSLDLHRMRSVRSPMTLAYSTPSEDGVQEYFDIVVETSTMSNEDWKKSFLFAWAVQLFHCLNLTQYLAIFFWIEGGVRYDDFYEDLLDYLRETGANLLGQQYEMANRLASRILQGESSEVVLPGFGSLVWLAEEAAFLSLIGKKRELYDELLAFLHDLSIRRHIELSSDLLSDLVMYQQSAVVDPSSPAQVLVGFRYDLSDYFRNAYSAKATSLKRIDNRLYFDNDAAGSFDLETFALEFVRYGRKSNKLHTRVGSVFTLSY